MLQKKITKTIDDLTELPVLLGCCRDMSLVQNGALVSAENLISFWFSNRD
jgi:hypothetical protein